MPSAILVIEDEATLAKNIKAYLGRYGYEVRLAESGEAAIQELDEFRPDIVLLDFMLPGMNGMDTLQRILAADPQVKAIMMTGEGNTRLAVDAMKAGAVDYLSKPLELGELKMLVDKTVGQERMEGTLSYYQRQQAAGAGLDKLVGNSQPMKELKELVRQILVAEQGMTDGDPPAVLINGETGTGKELVARALHFDGPRSKAPFVEVNCASIPSNLLEAELFGHERGAFTDAREKKLGLVEAATGGTLFLDEIGEVDLSTQVKLLKLLEEKTVRRLGSVRERKVDLRIITATNRDLEAMVREGKFRSDLYFRLRIIHVQVPPLRERGKDILLLAEHFLKMHGARYGKKNLAFSPQAEQVLMEYDWPGNVREMRNMLEQTVLLARGDSITPNQLAICPGLSPKFEREFISCSQGCRAAPKQGMKLEQVEKDMVMQALEKTGGNVTKAAKLLGISRDTMRYRIEKYDIKDPLDDLLG